MPLKVHSFSKIAELELFLRGGIRTGALPPLAASKVLGLDGLTLIFAVPSVTVTFSDPTQAGLTVLEILTQVNDGLGTPAVTTEGSVDLTAAFPAITTETLIISINGLADTTVTFASPADQAALLAAIDAITVPLGVTSSVGSGTPNGLVLTTSATGPSASIEIKGGTVNALVGISPELVTGPSVIIPKFQARAFTFEEVTPTNGVSLTGGTALSALGISPPVTNVVYNPSDGAAPRFQEWIISPSSDGFSVLVEEV